MRVFRSIASVLLTYIVVFCIVSCSDPLLAHLFPGQYVAGKVPPVYLLWISTAIFALASVLGGWMCVTIAPSKPSRHLLSLFVLGEVIGVVFTVVNWSKWPHWNSLVWLAVWPLCLWIGGRLKRERRSSL